jgi:hypothetical protein
MVGRDSVYGASAALDGGIALNDAIVQLAGQASIVDVAQVRAAAEQSVSLRATLHRHEQVIFLQAQQSAACNAIHTVEERLSRWLLRMHDLSGKDTFYLTQEFLAQMIGARRNSVSLVANTLQKAGFIRYTRGLITITNVEGLTDSACECYQTIKVHSSRLLQTH